MNFKVIFVLIFGCTYLSVSAGNNMPIPCTPCVLCTRTRCNPNDLPVCGKRKTLDGCWQEKIFKSKCEMNNENRCGGGYIPCCVQQ